MTRFASSVTAVVAASSKTSCIRFAPWPRRRQRFPSRLHLGRQAQVDWGTFKKPGRKRVQGFVMTLGWSRAKYLDFTDSQALALFLGCHEQAFHYLGGVPEEILYDRVKTVWLHDDEHGDPVFHPGFVDFAEYYGFRPRLCRAQRPQTKGKTENGVGMCARTSGLGSATTARPTTCSTCADAGWMRPATCASTALLRRTASGCITVWRPTWRQPLESFSPS